MDTRLQNGKKTTRLVGYLIDQSALGAMQGGGAFLGAFVAGAMQGSSAPEKVLDQAMASGGMLGMIFWGWTAFFLNYGVLQAMTGSSLGKLVVGLKIVNADGSPLGFTKSMARGFAYTLSSLPFFFGFAAIFWTKNQRCLHDIVCGTLVVKTPAPAQGISSEELTAPSFDRAA